MLDFEIINGKNNPSIFIIVAGSFLLVILIIIGMIYKRKIKSNRLRGILWSVSHGLIFLTIFMIIYFIYSRHLIEKKIPVLSDDFLLRMILSAFGWITAYLLFYPGAKKYHYDPYSSRYLEFPLIPDFTLFITFGFILTSLIQIFVFSFVIFLLICDLILGEVVISSLFLWYKGRILITKEILKILIILQIFTPFFINSLLNICGFLAGGLISFFIFGCIGGGILYHVFS